MKFEKLNNDKIKITLNNADLEANDMDLHSFMSDSNKTQSLFLSVLDTAERDYGFCTDNYQLKVETLALDNGSFIMTITRSKALEEGSSDKLKFKVSRKVQNTSTASLIYKFNSFEDFCEFVRFVSLSEIDNVEKSAKASVLFAYGQYYYLVLKQINVKYPYLKSVYSVITEFATYVDYSEAFIAKLYECGTLVIKNHAFKVCEKYFLN